MQSIAMQRVLSPLTQLRYEGAHIMSGHDVAVVGRDKTFQCLVMEERVRAAKTQCVTGCSPEVYCSPEKPRDLTLEEFQEHMASVPPPVLGRRSPSPYEEARPEDVQEYVDTGCQAVHDCPQRDIGIMTNERMESGNNRDRIIEANNKLIEELKEEEARLEVMVSGGSADIIDYLRSPERTFLLHHAEREKEERRAHAVLEATSAVNERQFMREQRKVDKRTAKRTQRFEAVQERIGAIKDHLLERGVYDAAMSPDGSPRSRASTARSGSVPRLASIHRLVTPPVPYAAQRRASRARGGSVAASLSRKMSTASSLPLAPSASPHRRGTSPNNVPAGGPDWHTLKQ